jgi:hypothetical protein
MFARAGTHSSPRKIGVEACSVIGEEATLHVASGDTPSDAENEGRLARRSGEKGPETRPRICADKLRLHHPRC